MCALAIVKFINHRNNDPKEQLDHLLLFPESSVYEGKTMFSPSATLDSLYALILQEAFGDDHLEDDPKTRSVLGAVTLATNPLSPSAIAALLGFSIKSVFLRLSSVHSLLILQEDTNHPVQPFHKSFPDFIVDPTRCINQRFLISPPNHHSELLIGCLELMNQRLEKNMCKLPDAISNDKVVDLQERIELYVDHTLQYACKSWHKHFVNLKRVPAHASKITSVLQQFLEERFLFWLEVLSLLGIVRVAVDALEVAAKCLEVCRAYMLKVFPEFTHTGSRHCQPLTSLRTAFTLSLDSLRSSANLLHISITQLSPCPPKHQLCGNYMNNIPIPC